MFKIARFGRAPLDGSITTEDRFWVTHGFARVLIDERGTGASFGTSGYGSAEVSDLREITEWVVKQPWSNGRVGAIGISVEGTASELLAATGHPAVRAVAPLFSDYNYYTDLIRPGGVYHEWLMKNFGAFVKEMDSGAAAKRVTPDADGSLLKQAIADHKNNAAALPRLRQRAADLHRRVVARRRFRREPVQARWESGRSRPRPATSQSPRLFQSLPQGHSRRRQRAARHSLLHLRNESMAADDRLAASRPRQGRLSPRW